MTLDLPNEIQELEQQIASTTDPQEKIDLINELAWTLRRPDWERAKELALEAEQLSQAGAFADAPYKKGQLDSLVTQSSINERLGNYQEALSQSFEALTRYKFLNDELGSARALGIIGFTYARMGNYSQGLDYKLQQLELAEALGNTRLQADALTGIGMIYGEAGDAAQALVYFKTNLDLYRELGNTSGEAAMLNNCAAASFFLDDFAAVIEYGRLCEQLCRETGNELVEVGAIDNIANAYAAMGQYDDALRQYEINLTKVKKINHRELWVETLLGIGRVYNQTDAPDQAIPNLQEALVLAQEINARRKEYQCQELLAQSYKMKGDFETALDHFEQFHQVEKQVFNEDKEGQLQKLEVRHRTEAAKKEAEIYREKNTELEREIEERQKVEAALRLAKEAAEIANRAKSDFLSNMSHELRTPLNGILGYAQIIKRQPNLSREQAEAIDIIYQSGDHLLTLINDILDISKIEAGKMELQPEPVHLPGLLDGVISIMQMRAKQQEIALIYTAESTLPASVEADPKRLRQILINLIGNAVKFTNTGKVSLHVSTLPATNNSQAHLRFEIIDTGIGISPEDLERIFLPFEQVSHGQVTSEGTGLGLSISRQLVEGMGGQIQAESEVGVGSRFWFDIKLPIVDFLPKKRGPERPIIGYNGNPQTLLIVDDREDNRTVLVSLLEPLGFAILEASDGQQCLELAQQENPDAIFLDLVMPTMTGFDVVQHLRQIPALQQTPVIAVSASAFNKVQLQSIVAGFDAFLSKPVDMQLLLDLLQSHLALEWQYAEPPPTTKPVTPTEPTAALIPPPPEEIETLYEMALIGDLMGIEKYTVKAEENNVNWHAFAQEVRHLARSFEEEKIIALLEKYQTNK